MLIYSMLPHIPLQHPGRGDLQTFLSQCEETSSDIRHLLCRTINMYKNITVVYMLAKGFLGLWYYAVLHEFMPHPCLHLISTPRATIHLPCPVTCPLVGKRLRNGSELLCLGQYKPVSEGGNPWVFWCVFSQISC